MTEVDINKCTITSVAIKDEYLKEMDDLKELCGITKKYIINAALREFLDKHRDSFVAW